MSLIFISWHDDRLAIHAVLKSDIYYDNIDLIGFINYSISKIRRLKMIIILYIK